MLQKSLLIVILSFGHIHFGVATNFSAHDPYNPDPRLYCTNKVLGPHDLVVAHPTLPCGTRVLIWAPRTERSVIARVEDRGPRHADLDLAPATARALHANGMEEILFVALGR